MTNKRVDKREKHFNQQQRKRAALSKKIDKAKAGHDQWTGWERRDRLAPNREVDE